MNKLRTKTLLFLFSTLFIGHAVSQIDQGSVTSLQLTVLHNEVKIGSATGFVVEKQEPLSGHKPPCGNALRTRQRQVKHRWLDLREQAYGSA
jgi:hypothetical protein